MLGRHNNEGQLGNNSNTSSDIPVPVFGLGTAVTAIDTGGFLQLCNS